MKNLIFGHSLKNLTFRAGISQKTNKEEGLHKKRGLDSFQIYRRTCEERGGWQFLREGELITQCISCFLTKLKGKGRSFLEGPKKRATLWDYPQELLVVIREEKISPFVKFEVILHLLCFLLHLLTDKLCKAWSSMINLWIDSRTYQK